MKPSGPTMLPFTALQDKGLFLPACLFKGDFVLLRGAGWIVRSNSYFFIALALHGSPKPLWEDIALSGSCSPLSVLSSAQSGSGSHVLPLTATWVWSRPHLGILSGISAVDGLISKGKIHINMNIQDMSETCWEKAGLTCCSDSLCTTCQLALFATSIFVDQPLQGKALVIPHQLKDEIFQLTEGLVSTGLVWSRVFCRLFIFPMDWNWIWNLSLFYKTLAMALKQPDEAEQVQDATHEHSPPRQHNGLQADLKCQGEPRCLIYWSQWGVCGWIQVMKCETNPHWTWPE